MPRTKAARKIAPPLGLYSTHSLGESFGRVSFTAILKDFASFADLGGNEDIVVAREAHTATVKGNTYKFEFQFRIHGDESERALAIDVIPSDVDSSFSFDCCRTYAAYRFEVKRASHCKSTGASAYQIPMPNNRAAKVCPGFAGMRDIFAENSKFLVTSRGHLYLRITAELYHRPCPLFNPSSSLSSDLLCSLSGAKSEDEKGSILHFLVDGKAFSAHRSILRARGASLLIDLAEETVSSRDSPIPIDGVNQHDFDALLRYLYADEIVDCDTMEDAVAMLELADKFGIVGLKLRVERELTSRFIDAESVAELLLLADAKNCALLKEQTISFFAKNHTAVLKSPGWALLKESASLQAELWETFSLGDRKRPAKDDADYDEMKQPYKRRCVSSLLEHLEMHELDLGGSRELLENRLVEHDKACESSSDSEEYTDEEGGEDGEGGDVQVVE